MESTLKFYVDFMFKLKGSSGEDQFHDLVCCLGGLEEQSLQKYVAGHETP